MRKGQELGNKGEKTEGINTLVFLNLYEACNRKRSSVGAEMSKS